MEAQLQHNRYAPASHQLLHLMYCKQLQIACLDAVRCLAAFSHLDLLKSCWCACKFTVSPCVEHLELQLHLRLYAVLAILTIAFFVSMDDMPFPMPLLKKFELQAVPTIVRWSAKPSFV